MCAICVQVLGVGCGAEVVTTQSCAGLKIANTSADMEYKRSSLSVFEKHCNMQIMLDLVSQGFLLVPSPVIDACLKATPLAVIPPYPFVGPSRVVSRCTLVSVIVPLSSNL